MNLHNRSVVFLCILLLSDLIYCKKSIPQNINIELPVNDSLKTIEIHIIENYEIPSLTIKCLNYDALNDLNGSILKQINWTPLHGKWIIFANCFNNETSHDNYKSFKFEEFLNTGSVELWESLDVTFNKFGFVDENEFFKNFKFPQYKSIYLYNIGFKSTTFLSQLVTNSKIKFGNCNLIDFNQFINNSISRVEIIRNNVLNFNSNNLRKFTMITELELYYNNFSNETFNEEYLFKFNPTLIQLLIENSVNKLVFHESVFFGLLHLEHMSLAGNQLEDIPENIFRELINLKKLILDKNMLTNLSENTFLLNKKLTYLSLDGNKLITFSETTNNLNFGASQLYLSLQDIEFSSIMQLQNILNNPNIGKLDLSKILEQQLSMEDFKRFQNRTNQIVVRLEAGLTYFSMPGISAGSLNKPNTEYALLIQIDVGDESRMCNECNFIKQVFPSDGQHVFAQDANILFEFTLSLNCRTNNMLEHFYRKFDENCPEPCECHYNEFIDKMRIDCSNKNLTTIPFLRYPTQFNHIDSIDLLFKNNLLRTVEFANQNAFVMGKLSTLDFENNSIESLNMDGNPPKFIHYFNLCDNPILQAFFVDITTVNGVEQIASSNCFVGNQYLPEVKNYVQTKSEERVKELLETCV